jgi:hypothetical protein
LTAAIKNIRVLPAAEQIWDGEDYLVFKDQRMFKMGKKRGILMLKTRAVLPHESRHENLNKTIDELTKKKIWTAASTSTF